MLKICGLMRQTDVAMCCRLGVDICGFVTEYPLEVPWNLTRKQCIPLLAAVTGRAQSCLVTGGTAKKIISLALELKPDLVQLHYHETLEDTRAIVGALAPHGIGVIKTLPAAPEDRRRQFGTADVVSCAKSLSASGVHAILVDSRGPSNAAAGGSLGDPDFYRAAKSAAACPVMLGGGITPENCGSILADVRPDIIDIMTGVETGPGEKSEEHIRKILEIPSSQ